jgi:hypothetical protein
VVVEGKGGKMKGKRKKRGGWGGGIQGRREGSRESSWVFLKEVPHLSNSYLTFGFQMEERPTNPPCHLWGGLR